MRKLVQAGMNLLFVIAGDVFVILRYTKLSGAARYAALVLSFLVLAWIQIMPRAERIADARIFVLKNGTQLLRLFLLSAVWNTALFLYLLIHVGVETYGLGNYVFHALFALFVCLVTFWNGILRIYLTSVQLGIKWRVIGAICGMIPFVNLFVLIKLIRIVEQECAFEQEKQELDAVRCKSEVCRTRYPILLVHGVFFRDSRFFNYWGRIPAELKRNGAVVYYGNQQSAASVPDSGRELAVRIREIVEQSGCGKVNIIAHSKGGLDSRYAVSCLGMEDYVASLTTINTPHTGCMFADYLLNKTTPRFQQFVAAKYNSVLKKLGDINPDFLAAVGDLTASHCEVLNNQMRPVSGVLCQSVGSNMDHAANGQFPLNLSYPFVRHFDGKNDGLVALEAMRWGESFRELRPQGRRGISHGDMIDLNRANLDGFDVREFYVNIVRELKERGL